MGIPTIATVDLAAWVTGLAADRERVLLGICGPPGAGKSTVAQGLAGSLGAPIVGMDGFHLALDVVEEHGWVDVKGAPHTFDAHGFVSLLGRLANQRDDEIVYAPRYDRAARNPIGSAVAVSPEARLVIIEGNYLLLGVPPWDEVASILTASVYIDLEEDVRIQRLIDRHIAFGKSADHARRFVLESDETNARLVSTTRGRADVIVEGV